MIKLPSPNFDDRGGASPEYLILHYTGMETAKDALDRLTDPDSGVSAHFTIDESGAVYQHVETEDRAWHAGQSYWRGINNLNAHSIGIELVNPGHDFGYRSFSRPQTDALVKLAKDLMRQYKIPAENVLGHSDIAPERKLDPGELFPWSYLAERGVGIWPEIPEDKRGKVAALDVYQALADYGYDPEADRDCVLMAFQRHFQPEAFTYGTIGEVDEITKGRLYALLTGDLQKPEVS